jgi:ketosteroid isomerase-like protein
MRSTDSGTPGRVPADSGDDAELISLQHEWMDAWRRRDREALERILAPEFILTSARSDRLMPRDLWLETAMTRASAESFRYDDFRVDVFGDAAVVRSRLSQVATVDGEPWNDTFMLTDVWIRRDGRWQVVARHASTPPARSF